MENITLTEAKDLLEKMRKWESAQFKEMMNKNLKNEGNLLIEIIKTYIDTIEICNLTNEQWFIDWENELNKLSVKDHNDILK